MLRIALFSHRVRQSLLFHGRSLPKYGVVRSTMCVKGGELKPCEDNQGMSLDADPNALQLCSRYIQELVPALVLLMARHGMA